MSKQLSKPSTTGISKPVTDETALDQPAPTNATGAKRRRRPLFTRMALAVFVVSVMVASGLTLYSLGFDIYVGNVVFCALVAMAGVIGLLLGQLARHRLQISLRTGLVAIAALCGLFALWNWKVKDERAESQTARWIQEQGGRVVYVGFTIDRSGRYIDLMDGRYVPRQVGSVLGESFFGALEEASLRGTDASDEDVSRLATIRQLRELHVDGSDITAAGVASLPIIPGLERLTVDWSQVSPQSIARLKEVPGLRQLGVAFPKNSQTRIDARNELLGELTQLENLGIAEVNLTNAAAEAIASLPKLKQLSISWERTTSAANAPANNAALVHLAASTSLEEIWISQSQSVAPDVLDALTEIPTLKTLYIFSINGQPLVSQQEFDELRRRRPDIELNIDFFATDPSQLQPRTSADGNDADAAKEGG